MSLTKMYIQRNPDLQAFIDNSILDGFSNEDGATKSDFERNLRHRINDTFNGIITSLSINYKVLSGDPEQEPGVNTLVSISLIMRGNVYTTFRVIPTSKIKPEKV